jgi:hypothetical protein
LDRNTDAEHVPLRLQLDEVYVDIGLLQARCEHHSGETGPDDEDFAWRQVRPLLKIQYEPLALGAGAADHHRAVGGMLFLRQDQVAMVGDPFTPAVALIPAIRQAPQHAGIASQVNGRVLVPTYVYKADLRAKAKRSSSLTGRYMRQQMPSDTVGGISPL